MRCALEQVIEIVTESRSCGESKTLPASLHDAIKDFKVGPEKADAGGAEVRCRAARGGCGTVMRAVIQLC